MRIKVLIAPLAILLFALTAFAENVDTESNKGTIAGRIIDENGLPIPGATVYIKEINKGTISDVNGFYRIPSLTEGEYELKTSYIGFKDASIETNVKAAGTTVINLTLKAGLELQEVVVNGSMQGRVKAINQQKNSINITNIISSDQATRFPDANIGDALKRVPGINVQYDQGEARFGNIRGTAPELNSVTINGDRIPSAEAEIRSIQLDLVPADMIQTIEVNKVVTPDMDADAIGGSVNLITRNTPSKQRISGTIGSGYNFLSEKPAEMFSLVYGDRYLNDKLGMVLSGSYQNNRLGSDNIETEWEKDDEVYISDFQIRTYNVQRLRQSYSASFDYQFNPNHKIELKGIYNHRKDWENRFRVNFKGIEADDNGGFVAEMRRETKAGGSDENYKRLEDQKAMNFSLNGEHFFNSVKLKWKASYAKASEDRPHERYISYRMKDVSVTPNLSDINEPKFTVSTPGGYELNDSWDFKELTEEFQYTEDIDKNFKVDLSFPWLKGNNPNEIMIGARYRGKEKSRDNTFFEYEPTDEDAFNANSFNNLIDKTKNNFLAGDYTAGSFISNKYLGNLDLANTSDFEGEEILEEEAGNFDAKEDIIATYLRLDQKIGDKLSLIAGVRMETTSLNYSGYEFVIDEEGDELGLNATPEEEDNYINILPSLIGKWSLSEQTKIKMAWTNTIARPKYFDLVPHVEINMEDLEANIGNPSLEPTKSMNFDFMAEHYFKSIGYITGGIFYKDIQDFIVEKELRDYSYEGTVYDKFKQPINAGDAKLWGLEASFQRQFDFLGGFWSNLGFYANYTYNHSKVENFAIEGREEEDLSLPGTPQNTLNASLYYEGKKLTIRASFNYADDFIDEVGESAFYDRYYDKVTYLDLNAVYSVTPHLNIFVEANNLLNQPLQYYQGTSDRIMQAEYYNVKMNLGLKFDF